MMSMPHGLAARQIHHERVAHALGPRPEPYGPSATASTPRRSFTTWTRIANVKRWPALLIPRLVSHRTS